MHYDCDTWIVIWSNKNREKEIVVFHSSTLLASYKNDFYLCSGLYLSDIGNREMHKEVEEALLRVNRYMADRSPETAVTTWSCDVPRGSLRIVLTGVKR